MVDQTQADVVLSGNTPIDVQAELLWHCQKNSVGFVHWIQDIYCQALKFFLKRRLPLLASPIASMFELLERAVSSRSDHMVVITPEFRDILCRWNVPESKISVVENWAALEEMPQKPHENEWSRGQKLGSTPVLLYSGTLGMKHRPDLLYRLAEHMQQECTVVVITDGIGSEYLQGMPALKNLRILPFQAYEKLPEAPAAPMCCWPRWRQRRDSSQCPPRLTHSRWLSILLCRPRENLSASIIERSGAGLVVDPNDLAACIEAAKKLIRDANFREHLGKKVKLCGANLRPRKNN